MTKLYLMDGGIFKFPAMWVGIGKQGLFTAGIPYVYIEHPEARILLDTGADGKTHPLDEFQAEYNFPPELEMKIIQSDEQRLEYYLDRLRVKPEQIDLIITSHLHSDHVGFNYMFTNATCIVQREELRHAYVPEKFETPYYRRDIDLPSLRYECIDGDYLLFSDIEILSTPGHTAGSQSIAIHLENAGTILFVGDLLYIIEHFKTGAFPHIWWAPSMTQWTRSLERIRSYVKEKDAKLFVYHDYEDFIRNWKQYPYYYD